MKLKEKRLGLLIVVALILMWIFLFTPTKKQSIEERNKVVAAQIDWSRSEIERSVNSDISKQYSELREYNLQQE